MQPTRPLPVAMRASSRRIAIHVAVIGVHLMAWLACFHGTVPAWRAAAAGAEHPSPDRLRIRLVPIASPVSPRTPMVRPTRARRPSREHRLATRTPANLPAPAPVVPARGPMLASPAPDYVAGGDLLQGGASAPPPVRLPGSATPIVQGFHMVDPRMQGIGGAVRALQALLGVADPHCVDVEVWRGMTVAEQLARHISAADIERTAEQYHCGPG